MPNVQEESGIEDKPWERIRVVLCIVNEQRSIIRTAERRLDEATTELYHVLWPRTDKKRGHGRGEASDADIPNGNTVLNG